MSHLALVLLGHDAADCALHCSGDVVDVLGLDHRGEFVLENLGGNSEAQSRREYWDAVHRGSSKRPRLS